MYARVYTRLQHNARKKKKPRIGLDLHLKVSNIFRVRSNLQKYLKKKKIIIIHTAGGLNNMNTNAI